MNQNPFAALQTNNSGNSSENRQAGQENTQPLPNPWGPRQNQSNNTTNQTSTTSATSTTPSSTTPPSNMNNIFSQLLGSGAGAGLMGSNSVQDYAQQILQNPRQMEQMLGTPYMQSMLEMMSSNPELSRTIVQNSPQLASNPELRDQVLQTLPNMLQQVK